jgi:hypothetical protein
VRGVCALRERVVRAQCALSSGASRRRGRSCRRGVLRDRARRRQ